MRLNSSTRSTKCKHSLLGMSAGLVKEGVHKGTSKQFSIRTQRTEKSLREGTRLPCTGKITLWEAAVGDLDEKTAQDDSQGGWCGV